MILLHFSGFLSDFALDLEYALPPGVNLNHNAYSIFSTYSHEA